MASSLSPFLPSPSLSPSSSSLPSTYLITPMCRLFVALRLFAPLHPAHIHKKNAHIYAPRSALSCPTFSSLFSQVVSSPWLPCNPCTYSLLYCHPFVLLLVDRASTATQLPVFFNRQPSLRSQCFIVALALLPGQAIPHVTGATLSEPMLASYLI